MKNGNYDLKKRIIVFFLVFSIAFLVVLNISASAKAESLSLPKPWVIEYPEGYTPYYNENSARALAKLVWKEGRGIASDEQKSAIMWVVINRVECGGYGNSLWEVITSPHQFAYRDSSPVDPHLYNLAKDVLIRWDLERCGYENVGRTIPSTYLYFTGDGERNYFRDSYSTNQYWDWRYPTPYST